MNILARLVFCGFVSLIPFALYAYFSEYPDAGLVFLIPIFAFGPLLTCAIIIFFPLELLLDRLAKARLKNVLIPLVGGLLPLILSLRFGNFGDVTLDVFENPGNYAIWHIGGFLWGVAWRVSSLIAWKRPLRT